MCLRTIADTHRVSLATVALRWALQQPHVRVCAPSCVSPAQPFSPRFFLAALLGLQVSAVVVGGRDASHIEAYQLAHRIALGPAELSAIAAVLAKGHAIPGDGLQFERTGAGPYSTPASYVHPRKSKGSWSARPNPATRVSRGSGPTGASCASPSTLMSSPSATRSCCIGCIPSARPSKACVPTTPWPHPPPPPKSSAR